MRAAASLRKLVLRATFTTARALVLVALELQFLTRGGVGGSAQPWGSRGGRCDRGGRGGRGLALEGPDGIAVDEEARTGGRDEVGQGAEGADLEGRAHDDERIGGCQILRVQVSEALPETLAEEDYVWLD